MEKTINSEIISTALKYLGEEEILGNLGFKDSEFETKMKSCGWKEKEAWCAYFTTWVLKNTKMDDGNSIYSYLRTFGSINDGAASGLWPAFRNGKEGVSFNKSKAYGGNYTPKKGDVVWFQWAPGMAGCHCRKIYGKWNGSTQCSDHVGIVRAVRDGKVYTTEGNSGNKVSNKEYPIDTEYITAYGSWYK